MKRLVIALVLWTFGSDVMAANWVTVGEPREGYGQIAIDLDSVRPTSESGQFVELTWRRVRESPSEFDSELDCQAVSMINKVMRYPSGGKTITIDFLSPSTTKSGTDNLRELRYWFPEWRNAQLHRAICPRFNPNWEESWIIPRPVNACQSAKSFYEKRLCSGHREELGDYNLMVHRLAQLQASCSITQAALRKIAGFFYDLQNECKDESCLSRVTTYDIFLPMDKSLRVSMYGEKCTFVDDRLVAIERWSRKTSSYRDYRYCVTENIPVLDDEISSAETVALALHAKCKPILSPTLTHDDVSGDFLNALAIELRPHLIRIVLEHRAAKRQLQEMERKKSPQRPIRP